MIRMSVFRDLGGYDADSFFLDCEDLDLVCRVREPGFRIAHEPERPWSTRSGEITGQP
jgi:GT2 family glycosyltransferase